MQRIHPLFCFGVALAMGLGVPQAWAAMSSPSDNGLIYYKLGGGEPLQRAPNRNMHTVQLGTSMDWTSPFSCTSFDPMATVSNQLNGMTDGFQDLMGGVMSNARGAVIGLAAMAIQRANPGLYDLLQKGVLGAKTDISFAEGSCESMQNMVASGGAGLDWEKWVHVSAMDQWRKKSQTQPDVIQAKRDIDKTRGDNGAVWVNGTRAGGTGQPSIQVNRDITKAGYNLQMNRPVDATSSVGGNSSLASTPLGQAWSTPNDAGQWAVDVLGDTAIRTCGDCQKKTGVPGKGLVLKYEEELDQIGPRVADLISGNTAPSDANLAAVSAPPNLIITRTVIEALQKERDADLLGAKLSGEIALARTMNRAMLLRRMMESGKREPNVAANEEAQADIERNLASLDTEMKNLIFELEMRQKLAGNTPNLLLERQKERERDSATTVPATSNVIKDGEVKQ